MKIVFENEMSKAAKAAFENLLLVQEFAHTSLDVELTVGEGSVGAWFTIESGMSHQEMFEMLAQLADYRKHTTVSKADYVSAYCFVVSKVVSSQKTSTEYIVLFSDNGGDNIVRDLNNLSKELLGVALELSSEKDRG